MSRFSRRTFPVLFCLFPLLPLWGGGGRDTALSGEVPSERTIVDGGGHSVRIPRKTERIVCLNSGLSVLTAALGLEEAIVGRDGNSTFPHSLKGVYVVARNSSSPNIELILEKRPDLVLADNMLPEKAYDQLTSLGIVVGVFKTSDPRRFEETLLGVGELTGRLDRAKELLGRMEERIAWIEEKAAGAVEEAGRRRRVFFENRKPYSSASRKSGSHYPIAGAGGLNIAAEEGAASPKLSVEYVMERNPEVIIRRISGDGTWEVMGNIRRNLLSRAGLEEVEAVRNDRVYIIKSDLFLLLRYPAGMAYLASWFYPDAFADFDPEAYHESLITELFGPEEWNNLRETFVYP